MTADPRSGECQVQASTPRSAPTWRAPWSWRLRARLRAALSRPRGAARPEPARAAPAAFPAADLRAGDLVRVRDAEYVRRTLDERGKCGGCSFAAGMWAFCGRELRVAKTVTRFFDEAQWRMLRARNLVLLEGAYCHGEGLADGPCDRTCFFFWRTEWLEKLG